MPVMNWLPNMVSPDASERNARLYESAKQGQADYLAKLAGIKQTGAATRGMQIKNEGEALALAQQKALNSLFSKHFDPETQTLDAEGFSKEAVASGLLSPEAVQTPMKTTAGALNVGADAAKNAALIQSYGAGDVSKLTAQPKKPSMAPAAATTSKPESGFQAFAQSLAGVKQAPAPYDTSKDVATVAGALEKSLPPERKALAGKRLSEVGAPNFQAALSAEAERYLGTAPQPTDFPGEPAKYKAALLERQARERGLRAHLQDYAGGLVPAGLATTAGIQSKEQSAATFKQGGQLTGWQEAGVPERSMPEAVATEAKRDLANVRTLEKLTTDLGKGAATDDAIRDAAQRLAGRIDANTVLGVFPSLGKSVAEEGLRKGGTDWIFNQLRGDQKQAAKLIERFTGTEKSRIKELIKTSAPGVDLKKLDSYVGGSARRKLTPEEFKKLTGGK